MNVVGETATVSVDVKNTGKVAGDEVVQLYVHQRSGSDSRPMRELKGFRRLCGRWTSFVDAGRPVDGELLGPIQAGLERLGEVG